MKEIDLQSFVRGLAFGSIGIGTVAGSIWLLNKLNYI